MVLEVKTDPNVPPLPPHITLEQAKKFTSFLLKGDPDEGSVLVETRAAGAEHRPAGKQGLGRAAPPRAPRPPVFGCGGAGEGP